MSILGLGNPAIYASGGLGACPDCPDCPDCPPDPVATAVNMLWGPAAAGEWQIDGYPSLGTLNDADNSVAMIFVIPKAGSITKIGVWCSQVTGNPPAYNAGLVTVDATTGLPNTAAYGGATNPTYAFTATGWHWIDLTVPATAVAGESAAVWIWPTASAPDGSNYAKVAYGRVFAGAGGMPRGGRYTTDWTWAHGVPALAVQYATGEVYGVAAAVYDSILFDAADTPDELGCKFIVPTDMVCYGANVGLATNSSNASYTVKLYDAAGTLIASRNVTDEDEMVGGVLTTNHQQVFWTPVTLTAGQTYRLTILGTHATATITPAQLTFESAASLTNNLAIPEGSRWSMTQRTDAGAWTDTAEGLVWMALWINSMTLPG